MSNLNVLLKIYGWKKHNLSKLQIFLFFLEALFKTDEGSFIDKASEKKYLWL